MTKILITGATGKMGQETVRAIKAEKDFELSGCVGNSSFIGQDIGILTGIGETGIKVSNDLLSELDSKKPEVLIDLTHGEAAVKILREALNRGINCITGSTGFLQQELVELKSLAESKKVTLMVIPNFSIGAVLMTMLAEQSAKYFDHVEIIEMHHEKKKDSPSGTALKTAEMIMSTNKNLNSGLPESLEKVEGCRGGTVGNINIHSVRMPGFVASQEVIFGGLGQTLTIRHDTINRQAFMPGIILCIRKLKEVSGYIYGLESLLK